jgi:hypothetical protein
MLAKGLSYEINETRRESRQSCILGNEKQITKMLNDYGMGEFILFSVL